MKRCPYCGKEYSDDYSVCAIDENQLESCDSKPSGPNGTFMSEAQLTSLRVYTPWQVCVSCLIGGPASVTWLIAENFRAFENWKKRKLTFLYGAIALVALIGLGLVLPKHSSGTGLAALVAVAAREITKHQQGSQIEELRAKGGRIASWWRAVGIGVLGLVATLIVIFILVLVLS
jgi:hypothetical protein